MAAHSMIETTSANIIRPASDDSESRTNHHVAGSKATRTIGKTKPGGRSLSPRTMPLMLRSSPLSCSFVKFISPATRAQTRNPHEKTRA